MADKGGKGFPMANGKMGTKKLASKRGRPKKDGFSAPEARHVQIDCSSSEEEYIAQTYSKEGGKGSSETMRSGKNSFSFDELKTGGKASLETPSATGSWGKGATVFSSGKAGGKGSLPRATPLVDTIVEVELKLEMDYLKNSRVLMDCEAAVALQAIQEHLIALSEDPKIKIPESFNKALLYSKLGNHYKDVPSVRQALDTLKTKGVTDGEICMIGNALPETVDEAYALIPSLKANRFKNEEALKDVLLSLAKLRTPK